MPWLLAVVLFGGPVSAREFWQVQQGTVTVIAAASPAMATKSAARVLQLQSAARWLLGWPADFQPPPALVFALDANLVRDTFERPLPPAGADVGPMAMRGSTLVTPQLTLVLFPLGIDRGRELDTLQYLYGQTLLGMPPARAWPECPRLGFGMLFAAAEFSGENHMSVQASKVQAYRPMKPEEFLGAPSTDPPAQLELDRRGYGCYVLSYFMATSEPELRRAFAAFFTTLGAGTPLESAVPAELGGSLPEFSKRYLQYADRHQFDPREHDIRVELPEHLPVPGAPTPVTPERMRALLGQLCARLGPCRPGAP